MKTKRWIMGLLLATMCAHALVNSVRAAPSEIIQYFSAEKESGASKAVVVDDVPLAHTAQFMPFNEKGEIVGKGNVALQTKQLIGNLKQALALAGADWKHLVKLNVYVSRDENVESIRKVLAQTFSGRAKPAVSFVTGDLTASDALVAMDAIAVVTAERPSTSVQRMAGMPGYKDRTAAVATLPSGGKYYISGQAKNGALQEATLATLESLEETLKFLSLSRSNVVQLKAFVQPITDKAIVEATIAKFFQGELGPPVVYVEWNSPTNTPIEIEMIISEGKPQDSTGESVTFSTPPKLTLSKVFSRVAHVRHGKTIYLSGLYGKQSIEGAGQVGEIFETLKNITNETGSDMEHLVKATYYVSDNEASGKLNDIRPKFYNPERPPAASKAMVRGVGMIGKTITVDMIAVTK